jgi:hypothetical protein
MIMTTIEKSMIGAIVAVLCIVGGLVFSVSNSIDDAGGMKNIIIEAGKEIKDISREIRKD